MRIPVLITALLLLSPGAKAACLTPNQAREAVPTYEHTRYDEIQDLSGAAYIAFLRTVADDTSERPPADEAMIFYRHQIGHGADFRVVWFQQGCAVAKASYPAQFWQVFVMAGLGT